MSGVGAGRGAAGAAEPAAGGANSAEGVAVIVPVRDGARYLAEALASVLAQTAPPAEIVVVDDGSRDGSGALAAAIPGVTVLTAGGAGAGPARNLGVAATAAPLLAFLDADDVWAPTTLAALAAARGGADLVRGRVTHFASPDLTDAERATRLVPRGVLPGLLPGAVLVTRAAFGRVGPFRADLRVGEFVDWYARAEDAGLGVAECDTVVLHRRVHARNTGSLRRDDRADLTRAVRAALARRRAAPS